MTEQMIYGMLMMVLTPIIIYGVILLIEKFKKPKVTSYFNKSSKFTTNNLKFNKSKTTNV